MFGLEQVSTQPRINPEFLENWEALHDEAHARRNAAEAGARTIRERFPNVSEDEKKELHRLDMEWKKAHEQCLRLLDVHQHRTYEDALAWINQNFCREKPVKIADNSKFETVRDQIVAAYKIYSSNRN